MDNSPDRDPGGLLAAKRHALQLTREALAARANVSTATLFHAEKSSRFTFTTLMALAKVFATRRFTALTPAEIDVLCKAAGATPGQVEALRNLGRDDDPDAAPAASPETIDAQAHQAVLECIAELETLIGPVKLAELVSATAQAIYAATPDARRITGPGGIDYTPGPRRAAVVRAWTRGEDMARFDTPAAGDVADSVRPALPSPPEPAAGQGEAAGPALRVTSEPKRYEWVDPATGRRHVMEEHQIHEYHPRAAGSSRASRAKDAKPKRAPRRKSG